MTCINPIEGALSVVMVQFDPVSAQTKEEVDANIDTIRRYVKRATNSFPGVDLVVFPEYNTTGFAYYSYHYLFAAEVPGCETEKLSKIASEAGVWLVASIVEKNPDPELMPYNAMLVFDPSGNIALKYRKMNPWNPKEPWSPGEEMPVCDGPKGTKLAVMLCYDGDLPEPEREAAWGFEQPVFRVSRVGQHSAGIHGSTGPDVPHSRSCTGNPSTTKRTFAQDMIGENRRNGGTRG